MIRIKASGIDIEVDSVQECVEVIELLDKRRSAPILMNGHKDVPAKDKKEKPIVKKKIHSADPVMRFCERCKVSKVRSDNKGCSSCSKKVCSACRDFVKGICRDCASVPDR